MIVFEAVEAGGCPPLSQDMQTAAPSRFQGALNCLELVFVVARQVAEIYEPSQLGTGGSCSRNPTEVQKQCGEPHLIKSEETGLIIRIAADRRIVWSDP